MPTIKIFCGSSGGISICHTESAKDPETGLIKMRHVGTPVRLSEGINEIDSDSIKDWLEANRWVSEDDQKWSNLREKLRVVPD